MNNIRLYDYQIEMKERIEAAFRSWRSVMVQMPTGTGKTHVLASVVTDEVQRAKNACVWIVAHRRELVEQIEASLVCQSGLACSEFQSSFIKVMSIQWLSKHYGELDEKPSLIVIDEAHHALARIYAEVMNAYPEAKKLGVTATPCRLNMKGFSDLFDVLLQSWSTKKFIADGRLSLYDYMSIKADSEDQRMVFGLTKRGADGDFSLKEMSEKLDVRPSIERLCDTVLRYAPGKKGITYAIDVNHAEHIAEYYREHGIPAVAISWKTSADERKRIVEEFKRSGDSAEKGEASSGAVRVLVNVDLFGEGFDCPDVEFIQLARPTLSLAKYLQQVGRGMRVFDGKKYCLILDNVGLYRLFGLPSDDRDWQAMFDGRLAGKGNLLKAEEQYDVAYSIHDGVQRITADEDTELITVMTHQGQRMDLEAAYGYEVTESEDGLSGIVDKAGAEVLPCIYNKVELKAYGIVKLCSRRKIDRERPWMDLRNGVRFVRRPRIERIGFLEFSTTDGMKLYPRVKTRWMDDGCFVVPDALVHGVNDGLRFKSFFIQPSEPEVLYRQKDQFDDVVLWESETAVLAWRKGLEPLLHGISLEEWEAKKAEYEAGLLAFEEQKERYMRSFMSAMGGLSLGDKLHLSDYSEVGDLRYVRTEDDLYQVFYREYFIDKWQSMGTYRKVCPTAYDLRVVQKWDGKYVVRTKLFKPVDNPELQFDYAELEDNGLLRITEDGSDYWVCLENRVAFTQRPEMVSIGFLNFMKVGDLYFLRAHYMDAAPIRRDEIKMGNGVCFVSNRRVFIRTRNSLKRLFIYRRYVDGKRFVLSDSLEPDGNDTFYDMYYDGVNPPVIQNHRERL